MIRVGLVMLQGARNVHMAALEKASQESGMEIEIKELRTSNDLFSSKIDAVIIPGGESTTMRLTGNSLKSGLIPSLLEFMRQNPYLPVLGTCAGAILLADPCDGKNSLIGSSIIRNAYGRQNESFQAEIYSNLLMRNYPGIFIRAPKFSSIEDPNSIIATFGKDVVGVRKFNRIALTFHPELSHDNGFHRWLVDQAIIYSEILV
ncbi:MAG: 5'-phosphate synthase pdxT subunit [Candidatus Thalassarchaeaceae archaeon]